jgi:hypothetical protein
VQGTNVDFLGKTEREKNRDMKKYTSTVALTESSSRTKSICLQTLKVGANDRSAKELQNGI